jgi:hypothetical protein
MSVKALGSWALIDISCVLYAVGIEILHIVQYEWKFLKAWLLNAFHIPLTYLLFPSNIWPIFFYINMGNYVNRVLLVLKCKI